MVCSKKRLEDAVAALNALKAAKPVEPGVPALKQSIAKLKDLPASQTIGAETFDTLDGKSDWRPARRGHMPYLAIPRSKAHELFGWGSVGGVEAAPAAVGTEFKFSESFLKLCEARKNRKGDAWTDDEKATLYNEVQHYPKRTKGLFEATAQALGLGSTEAVRLKVREYKQAQDDARKAAAKVTQVRDGKRVGSQ